MTQLSSCKALMRAMAGAQKHCLLHVKQCSVHTGTSLTAHCKRRSLQTQLSESSNRGSAHCKQVQHVCCANDILRSPTCSALCAIRTVHGAQHQHCTCYGAVLKCSSLSACCGCCCKQWRLLVIGLLHAADLAQIRCSAMCSAAKACALRVEELNATVLLDVVLGCRRCVRYVKGAL